MANMSDELKERKILKLILIVRFVCATLDVGHPIEPFVIFAQPVRDRKTRFPHVEALKVLRERCSHCRLAIGVFATDGDSGYDAIHQTQSKLNMAAFRRNHDISLAQHFRAILDIFHLFKRARYRLLKKITITLDLKTDTAELNLEKLSEMIGSNLPAVVFSDEPVTKMHDSLSMALFRFQILLKLFKAREFAWLTYFFPWVLINEGTSHKNVAVWARSHSF
jgi:hypothetical protein